VKEVMVGETPLSHAYAMLPVEGRPYDLYHGNLEARPVSANSSKLLYTLMYDVSNLKDQAAVDADVQRRRTQFENALKTMKGMAEAN
jgi:hypothetical protein